MKLKNKIFLPAILLLLVFGLHVNAQSVYDYKYALSEIVVIKSKILNEDRKIYIHCPKLDSADINKRFPVLYLLDADNHFELLSQYADYLSRSDVDEIPKIIVVGITNTDRTRDLTPIKSNLSYEGKPDTSAWLKTSGGNQLFLEFIKKELMPYIDSNYKTQPKKVFAGHSFGGLSAVNCMLTQPDMFDAYIAISPSFWWHNNHLLKVAEKSLKNGSPLNKSIFYCNGDEGGKNSFFHKGLLKFNAILATKKLVGLKHKYKYYPTDTHMTVPIVGYLDALRFVFKK
jgi:predicted alpha/beta superfamily hydrolase